jgi:maltose/moltooligosaccharide transporter
VEGQLLGSVPGGVVKNAVCDAIIVQTSALDEDRMLAEALAPSDADRGRPVTGSDTGEGSPPV